MVERQQAKNQPAVFFNLVGNLLSIRRALIPTFSQREKEQEKSGARSCLRVRTRTLPHPFCLRRGTELSADQGCELFEPWLSLRGPRLKRVPQGARSEAKGRRQ